jgi:hypothetical protein
MPGDFGGMISLQCLLLKLREGPSMASMPPIKSAPPSLNHTAVRCGAVVGGTPVRFVDDNEFNSLLS